MAIDLEVGHADNESIRVVQPNSRWYLLWMMSKAGIRRFETHLTRSHLWIFIGSIGTSVPMLTTHITSTIRRQGIHLFSESQEQRSTVVRENEEDSDVDG